MEYNSENYAGQRILIVKWKDESSLQFIFNGWNQMVITIQSMVLHSYYHNGFYYLDRLAGLCNFNMVPL